MARPKKEKEIVTSHRVTIRFTQTQYDVIAYDAKVAGLSVADYIRRVIANNGLTYEYKLVRDDKEIHDMIVALSKIGNNLNQIARHLHQGGASTKEIENDIRSSIAKIYEMSSKLDNIEGTDNGNP